MFNDAIFFWKGEGRGSANGKTNWLFRVSPSRIFFLLFGMYIPREV